jgi:hypothetical protein
MTKIAIGTIAECIRHNYGLRANCTPCHHTAVLDLQVLGGRLGFGHSTLQQDLAQRLRCSRCGSRDVTLTLSYDDPRWKTQG